MSTGTTLVKNALEQISAHSLIRPAHPESIEGGFNTLNSMLQLWLDQNIDLGIVPTTSPGEEVGEPVSTRQVIIDNLAVLLAPNREGGKEVVGATLRRNADNGFNMIRNLYQVFTIPKKVLSSTTPRGAGNTNRDGHGRLFFSEGTTLDN